MTLDYRLDLLTLTFTDVVFPAFSLRPVSITQDNVSDLNYTILYEGLMIEHGSLELALRVGSKMSGGELTVTVENLRTRSGQAVPQESRVLKVAEKPRMC